MIRLSAYQAPICQARRKEIKNRPISIDQAFNVDDDNAQMSSEENIIDESATIKLEDNLNFEDLINNLTEILNEINLEGLRKQSKKDNLSFLIDMNNYILVCNQTKTQLSLLKDLFYGYKRGELHTKYSNYNKHLNILKSALLMLYPQYNDAVLSL